MKRSYKLIGQVRPTSIASAISAILLTTGAARAQPAPEQQVEEVTVTGSRIQRRDFEANSPILTVDQDRFKGSSTIAMESVLNQLPQFVPAVTQFEPVPGGELSNTGGPTITPTAATVSLRGLGSNRNLVLLDGRRAMPVDASMAVDINGIPSAAIARVETITGGASSVYGADAVAGVVNFIIRDDLQGFNFDSQYGQTERGDGDERSMSLAFGQNFGNNGNIMLGVERYERGRVWQKDRDFYQEGWADPRSQGGLQVFYTAPYFTNAAGNGFTQAALNNVFNGSVSSTTGFGNYYLNADGSVYRTSRDGNSRYNGPTQTADGLTYRKVLQSNGTLSENWVDYQESSPMTRHSLFGRATVDLTDNVRVFAQGLFSESSSQSRGRVGGMVGGWGGTVPHGDGIYAPSVDTLGNTLVDYRAGGRFGLNCPALGGCTKSQAWPKSPQAQALLDSRPDREAPATVGIATTWFGNVRNDVTVATYQLVAGVEGELPEKDWTWEAYVSQGTTRSENEAVGTTSTQRWRYVINQPNYGAGLFARGNPEGGGFGAGAMECTSGFSTLGLGERYYLEATGLSNAAPSADCLRATGATLASVGEISQTVGEFNLQGGILEMPAGELGFALGASYRSNDFRWVPPPLNTPESIFDLPAGLYPKSETRGEISTSEVYGELLVPLLADKVAAKRLNLELGFRHSKNDPTEDVDSYKALLDWQVHDRVRIRGGHQVANRAPNVAELFQSADERLLLGFQGDWCSDLNPVNPLSANPAINPNAARVRAICESLMSQTGAATYYNNPNRNAAALHFFFAFIEGNPLVERETAATDTIGAVIDITDDITLSIDYWNIKVSNMISAQDPDSIYGQCFSPLTNPGLSPTAAACQQLVRDPTNGNEGNTLLQFTNEGAVDFAGYDVSFDWSRDLWAGQFNLNSVITIAGKTKTRVSPESPWNDWKGTSGPSDLSGLNGYAYDYRTQTSARYSAGKWSGTIRWRHLPSIESEGSRSPGSTFQPTGAYDVFDFSGLFSLGERTNIRFGVDNLFDRDPELTFAEATNSATGTTNRNFYDILGRRYYVGIGLNF